MSSALQQGERRGRKEGVRRGGKGGGELEASPPPSSLLAGLPVGNSGSGEGRERTTQVAEAGDGEPPVSSYTL